MQLTQRCQYGLRALFELAKRAGDPGQVLPAAEIAQAQAIPKRFLDGILLELRQAGFVDTRRGAAGGYLLKRPRASISVGEVIRHFDGAMSPVDCLRERGSKSCPLLGGCVFQSVWDEAREALEKVYDAVSLEELVERERRMPGAAGNPADCLAKGLAKNPAENVAESPASRVSPGRSAPRPPRKDRAGT